MLTYEDAKDLYGRQYQYVNSLLWERSKIRDFIFVQIRIAYDLHNDIDNETENAIKGLIHLKYELLSYPDIFNKVRLWLVMITGGNNEIRHVIKVKHVEDENSKINSKQVEKGMQERGGEVMEKALKLVEDNNFKLLCKGVGNGTWSILCHCSNKEAMLLCNIVREMFPNETDDGYIKLKRVIGFLEFQ